MKKEYIKEHDPEYQKKTVQVFKGQEFGYLGVDQVISKQMNHAKGWKCRAGMENLYIDYDGNVFVCNNSSSKLDRFNHAAWKAEIENINLKNDIDICSEENLKNGTFNKYLKLFNMKAGSFENKLNSNNPEDFKNNWGFLGNIEQGFKINDKVVTCPYETCGCGADIPIAKAKTLSALDTIITGEFPEGMSQRASSSLDSADGLRFAQYPQSTVLWDLGRRCNFDCSYCWPGVHNAREEHKRLDILIKTCENIISNLAPGTVKEFCFSGGEPTLHPDIISLLKFIKSKGHTVLITTNGSMKLERWKKVIHSIDKLQMSAHFEFINVDNFFDNLVEYMEIQLKYLFLGEYKFVDVKLMTAPGGVEKSVQLRDRINELLAKPRYFLLVDRRMVEMSFVPLRGIDDSEKMLEYTEEELQVFINQ